MISFLFYIYFYFKKKKANLKQVPGYLLGMHSTMFVVLVCSDINECTAADQLCGMNAYCSNNQGSFHCSCLAGFTGDGKHCKGNEYSTIATSLGDCNYRIWYLNVNIFESCLFVGDLIIEHLIPN